MKISKHKILLFISIISVTIFIAFASVYFSKVKICQEVFIHNLNDSKLEIYAISPMGGRIDFVKDLANNSFTISNRYLKEIIVIVDNPEKSEVSLELDGNTYKINSSSIIHIKDNKYKIKKEIYPKIGFLKKISFIKSNQLYKLIGIKLKNVLKPVIYIFLSAICLFLLSSLFILVRKNYKNIPIRLKSVILSIWLFILKERARLALLLIISFLIPLVYCLFSNNIIAYLNTSSIGFTIVFGVLIFPLIFMSYFSRKFQLNKFFWWSFLLTFVLVVFITKPSLYLFGLGFRDDISKFFVKAYNNNLLDSLFTPDSGYLNVFQNLVSFVLLKVFGFKQYFPEALQLTVALSFSAIFASFNLKRFRIFLDDDRYRFFISILFATIPFVFNSANFLFEIPFVIAAFLFLLLFTYFRKLQINKIELLIVLLLFFVFALSKPVFVIFIPFILLFIIYHLFYNKNFKTGILFIGILVLILIQTIITSIYTQELNSEQFNELGTQYDNAFINKDSSFLQLLPISAFLFVRKFSQIIGLANFSSGLLNVVVNTLVGVFIIFLFAYYLLKIIKGKQYFVSAFCVGSLFLSYLSILLYVKSVDIGNLFSKEVFSSDSSFYFMLRSDLRLPAHRYLMLSDFANFMVIMTFAFETFDKYLKSVKIRHMTKIGFLIFISLIPLIGHGFKQNGLQNKTETVSYWRLYNKLIFEKPDSYYIPYNGFPEQKHCIRNRMDKIFDINEFKGNEVDIIRIHSTAINWKVRQIILENDGSRDYPLLTGISENDEKISAELINGSNQPARALVYCFDDFYSLDKVVIQYSDSKKKYKGLVRIIGLYE